MRFTKEQGEQVLAAAERSFTASSERVEIPDPDEWKEGGDAARSSAETVRRRIH